MIPGGTEGVFLYRQNSKVATMHIFPVQDSSVYARNIYREEDILVTILCMVFAVPRLISFTHRNNEVLILPSKQLMKIEHINLVFQSELIPRR